MHLPSASFDVVQITKPVNALMLIVCNYCVRLCAPSVNVCINLDCANITNYETQLPKRMCSYKRSVIQHWPLALQTCSRTERVINDARKMETKQSDWLMHPYRTCMAARVVRIVL